MNQEDLNEVMWKSLPQWHKDQLLNERKEKEKNHDVHNNKGGENGEKN